MNIQQHFAELPVRALGAYLNTLALLAPRRAGAIALALFSRPRSHKSRTHNAELLSQARQERLEINASHIRYYHWEGAGPRVLLAHGWESNASRWAPLIHALQEQGYDLIAPDAPAHGYSGGKIFNVRLYAEALYALQQHVHADILIGHSAGGMAAVYLLYNHREIKVQHLVLLAVPSELERLMDTFRRMTYMSDAVFAGMQEAFQHRYGWAMRDFSLRRFIQECAVPGLLIHDREDPIAPYEEGLSIHQHWPGSRMITTVGLGHSLPGETVVSEILEHLNSTSF